MQGQLFSSPDVKHGLIWPAPSWHSNLDASPAIYQHIDVQLFIRIAGKSPIRICLACLLVVTPLFKSHWFFGIDPFLLLVEEWLTSHNFSQKSALRPKLSCKVAERHTSTRIIPNSQLKDLAIEITGRYRRDLAAVRPLLDLPPLGLFHQME